MKFKLNDIGLINKAEFDINKINVVCGFNSTGKSTVSKVLYCIFKSVCENKQYFALSSINGRLRFLINKLNEDYINTRNMDFFELIDVYENEKEQFLSKSETNKRIDDRVKSMDWELDIIKKDNHSLSLSIIKDLLKNEFHTREFRGKFTLNDDLFSISADFNEINKIDLNDSFKISGTSNIWDVYYLESFSLFDLNSNYSVRNKYYTRSDYLNKVLQVEDNLVSDGENKTISKIEDKIEKIINGKFTFKRGRFFYNSFDMENTASGIKQIGLIQMLLSSRNLRKNTFLIIDEPCVNLHPDWQLKFAEILVLLVRELNITLYINSHSPLFIEAVRTFSEKYDLLKDTNFYLTDESDIEGKFDFFKISNDSLSTIYQLLGEPYEMISLISMENEFRL